MMSARPKPFSTQPFPAQVFEPTRAAGLARLATFAGLAADHYATRRNADLGPDKRGNVSMLSPYIRHRLITETEVLETVLAQHSPVAAEKFVQEVFWRTYFKGHLETRPAIWQRYQSALEGHIVALQEKGGIRKIYQQAVDGRTGIDCFDSWIGELLETGYLHNHARMWFASIWIFTLRLPWELGADFMIRHLLDGDPASNTLSWRWVGGLHTRGKTYLARRDNIIANTGGRFSPKGLAAEAPPLDEPSLPPASNLAVRLQCFPAGRVGLLLTEEDLHPASLDHSGADVVAIAGAASDPATRFPQAEIVSAFKAGALQDGMAEAASHFGVAATLLPSLSATTLRDWARQNALASIVTAHAPTGPTATMLEHVTGELAKGNNELVQIRRRFDTLVWPHSTRGFFGLRERIPGFLQDLEIGQIDPDAQPSLF